MAPAEAIAESVYELRPKPGIRYQPIRPSPGCGGPADFTRARGRRRRRSSPIFSADGNAGTTADDYIYQIKRLAHPRLHSPIFGMMADKIVGLKELATSATGGQGIAGRNLAGPRRFSARRGRVVDSLTWRIRIKCAYPQFLTGWPCPSSPRC